MVAQMEGGGWSVSDWSPDGKQLLVTKWRIGGRELCVADGCGLGQEGVADSEVWHETVAYSNARFAKDGKSVYLTSDQDSEFQRLI